MEILQPQDQLNAVEFDLPFSKLFGLCEDFFELATSNEWHHEVESHICCEKVENIGQKGVIGI